MNVVYKQPREVINIKDPYNRQRKLKNTIDRIKNQYSWLSEEEKEVILQFKDQCLLSISKGRTIRYLMCLKKIAKEWLETDLTEAKKEDIKRAAAGIKSSDYSPWTKIFYKLALKKFYQWRSGEEWDSEDYPDKVDWLDVTIKKNHKKLPSEILSKEEVKKLIKAANKPRNKALVAVLYESGCRVGELIELKVKDIEFDKRLGAKIQVNGKTGGRVIRIVSSVPYLKDWLNEHPESENRESPVWRRLDKNEVLSYNRVRKILREIRERTDVEKPVNPHNFRHSRATHLANELTEAQMCEYFGWVQGSDQPATYVHLSGRDDNAILQTYGLSEEEKEEDEELKPIKCPRCGHKNGSTNKFCSRCGMPLDAEVAQEIEGNEGKANQLMEKLLKDPEVKELILEKISQGAGK